MFCYHCFEIKKRLLSQEGKKNQIEILLNETDAQLRRCQDVNASYVMIYLLNDHMRMLNAKHDTIKDNIKLLNEYIREHSLKNGGCQ